MSNPLSEQCDQLTSALVDAEDSGEDYSAEIAQLTELQEDAIARRNAGEEEPIEIPEDLADLVSKFTSTRQSNKLRREASGKLKEAVEQVGGIAGAEEFFTDRLCEYNGTIQVKDDNGNPRPINRDTISEMLPNSLRKTRRALESDELADLMDTRENQRKVVEKLRSQYGPSGGDSVVLSQFSFANKALKATEARIEEIKEQRRRDRQGPAPIPKTAPPDVISKFAQLSGACEREAKKYHSSGGQDPVSFQRWQSYKKQMRQIKAEFPNI
ncbi:MAG: hypothetical protein MPJ50_12345 [Pirellulales bacterium]|nr:hypothetical protein [Pirellulales bacterium]